MTWGVSKNEITVRMKSHGTAGTPGDGARVVYGGWGRGITPAWPFFQGRMSGAREIQRPAMKSRSGGSSQTLPVCATPGMSRNDVFAAQEGKPFTYSANIRCRA